MKRLITLLLIVTLTAGAQRAWAQRKGAFSDWNVPPPLPPGSIPKGAFNTKVIIELPITDVPLIALPVLRGAALTKLAPISTTAPDVDAPEQPAFPAMPFQVPDIPLPIVPGAIATPKQVPQEQPGGNVADLPVVPMPEMPDLPKMPDVAAGASQDIAIPIPITPSLSDVLVPDMGSEMKFPFIEWSIPAIPSNVHFNFELSPASDRRKLIPKPIYKVKRTHLHNK